jgi:hypothetical protein
MPGQGHHYRTFRERFCDHFTCQPTAFENTALLELFDPLPRMIAKLLFRISPRMLETDRSIVRRVSHIDSVTGVLLAAQDLEKEYVERSDYGALRRFFRLRLSRARLLKLTARLWHRPAVSSSSTPAAAISSSPG